MSGEGVALRQVEKAFDKEVILPSLDLDLPQGEFTVIVGPSGCGKSTTLRIIAGLEAVTGGNVFIGGKDVTWLPPKSRDIAMVFQSYALYPHMDAAGNMSFALKLAKMGQETIASRIEAASKLLGIESLLGRFPKELSGGQRQRVATGRAITREASVFLFDEPLSNLDAKLRAQMRTEIALLHKRLGKTMIFVTHDQIEAMTMADKIVVMSKGKVQQVGSPREVYHHPANRFVAGFIGSPAMNFFEGSLASENDRIVVTGQGFKLPLHKALAARLGESKNREVVLGLRPEHFHRKAMADPAYHSDFPIEVEVTEYVGSQLFVFGKIAGKSIAATLSSEEADVEKEGGEYVFDTRRAYLFDPKTGESLLGARPAGDRPKTIQ